MSYWLKVERSIVSTEARIASRGGEVPFKVCVAAPAYIGADIEHQRNQCRWFGGMVGNHVADIVEKYGTAE